MVYCYQNCTVRNMCASNRIEEVIEVWSKAKNINVPVRITGHFQMHRSNPLAWMRNKGQTREERNTTMECRS